MERRWRRARLGLVVAMAVALGPATAQAGVLASATLSVDTGLGPLVISRSASTSSLSGSSTATSAFLAAGSAFATTTGLPLLTAPATHDTVTVGHNGAIVATSGGVSATAPVTGTVKVFGLGSIIPGGTLLAQVPLVYGTSYIDTGACTTCVTGHAWTVGVLSLTGQTAGGSPLPTNTVATTGSFSLDGQGGGTVKLVTLTRVTISGSSSSTRLMAASLVLHFVPEPGTLLLLAAAAAGLAGAGRRRRASQALEDGRG